MTAPPLVKYSSYRLYCCLWKSTASSLLNLGDMVSSLVPVGQGRLEELSGSSTAEVGEQLPGAVDGQLLQALYPFHWCRVIDKPSPRPLPPPSPSGVYCRYTIRAQSIIKPYARWMHLRLWA